MGFMQVGNNDVCFLTCRICEGRKTKEEVLQAQLAKYKSAYEMVAREARKLDIAIGKYLAQEAENIPGIFR
ncbi:unnamed protein product [Hydatigera taeniaeformis]|uniref:DNA-directed DNA polymerase n=1 Tax=Hydatigena taeniaeformis TaxID=6205 RepID=A0A0R3WPA6_HYDTA|nr:unnamed protein product [Hydatigera taeniaeformis]